MTTLPDAKVPLISIVYGSEIPAGDSPPAQRTMWRKLVKRVHTVFGGYLECVRVGDSIIPAFRCIVNDEVRMAAWILLSLLTIIVAVLGLVEVISGKITFADLKDHKHAAAIAVAGCFALASTVITWLQVRAHHRYWTYPPAQVKIVRIILMVPIYAWSAWLGLVFVPLATYIDFIRVCYEAFVIFNFLLLLTKYLGGKAGVVKMLKRQAKQIVPWPSPCCCLQAHLNADFLLHIKRGTMQYVIISPIASFIAVVCGALDIYGDGVIDWTRGYVYIAIVQNVTQIVALYCLIWFYMISKDELAAFNPLAKFLVVKSVVFFTFWQGVGINLLVKFGVITGTSSFSAAEIQLGLQDFIICIEMFIAAAVHRYTFGHESYADGSFLKMLDDIISKDENGQRLADAEVREVYESDLADVDPDPLISAADAARIDRDLQLENDQSSLAPYSALHSSAESRASAGSRSATARGADTYMDRDV